VKTPAGDRYATNARPPSTIAAAFGNPRFDVVYPDEFPGAPALLPGGYDVEWRKLPSADSPTDQIAASLADPLRIDAFSIAARSPPA
jgi:hypothetical protein